MNPLPTPRVFPAVTASVYPSSRVPPHCRGKSPSAARSFMNGECVHKGYRAGSSQLSAYINKSKRCRRRRSTLRVTTRIHLPSPDERPVGVKLDRCEIREVVVSCTPRPFCISREDDRVVCPRGCCLYAIGLVRSILQTTEIRGATVTPPAIADLETLPSSTGVSDRRRLPHGNRFFVKLESLT